MWQMIKADLTRAWKIAVRYPVDLVATLVTLSVLYLGIYWANRLVPGQSPDAERVLGSVVGFLLWYFLVVVVGALSTSLQTEADQGTLEQLMLLPAGAARVLCARLISVLVRGVLDTTVVLGLMILITRVQLSWRLGPALLVLSISLVGLAGFGYALAGLTLLYKRVAGLTGLLNLAFMVLLGVANNFADGPLRILIRALPLAHGGQLLQQVLGPAGPPAGSAWTWALLALALNSLCYLAAGLLLFGSADRLARRRGVLGHF